MFSAIKLYGIKTDVTQIKQVHQKAGWKLPESFSFFQCISVLAEQTSELEKFGGFCYGLWRLILIKYVLTWTSEALHYYEYFRQSTSQSAIS